MTLSATDGNLSVGGAVTSMGNLKVTSGGSLALNGELVNGDTTINSGGTATLTGAFLGLGLVTINAGGSVNGGGSLTFGKDIAIDAGGDVALGGIQGAGLFTAVANGDMSFGATTAVGDVTARSTSGSVSFGGDLQSGGSVAIQAARNATVTGAVSSMGTVNVTGTQGNVAVAGVSSNGDTTMSAGQTLTLSGTSTVAGQFALSGGNITLSGSQGGSKNVSVTAQGTLDASQASMVSTGDMQFSGTNVTLGTAIVGGTLTATATSQLSLMGAAVDAVGAATLTSGNGFYNASQVLSGGALYVSAPNLTNATNASLASTTTTTINATNFTNAGLVNGATTNVTVAGALNNTGGSLMAVNGLTINTGSLNNQNGIIFAGNPNTPSGPVTGDVSLTINGGGSAFYNAGGQLLAQRNMGVSAVNAAFDLSQGTISQGGQLSITAGSINNTGTWNYGGQGVTLTGLNGINNSGTMTGTAALTLSTNGTFANFGQLTGNDVVFSGTLSNAAGAVIHASDLLTLNGSVTNRGTIESAGNLAFNGGGNYDNQYGLTQANGNIALNTGANVYNTVGSIVAGGNISIAAGAVINDAFQGPTQTTTQLVTMTGSLNWGSAFEAAAVAGITAGLTNGITYSSDNGFGFTTGPLTVGGSVNSLASLAGTSPLAGTSVSQASASTATTLETRALAMLGEAGISAGVGTAIEGGSLADAFTNALTQELAASGANAIGDAQPILKDDLGPIGGELAYLVAHAGLGCATSAVEGTGCAGGAIGGAASALTANQIATAVTGGQGITDQGQLAAIVAATMLLGGTAAGLLGQNPLAAATAAENETLNNTCAAGHNCGTLASAVADTGRAAWNTALGVVQSVPNLVNGALPGYPDYVPFLSGAMLPYDDPDFGSLVSLVGAVGAASLVGGSSVAPTNSAAVATYGPLNSGPLLPDIANTFRSGTYTEMVAQQPTTLYRVYGGSANQMGGYWTQTAPAGPVQSIIDSALLPQWGNPATNVVQIEIPAGTTYFTGAAAPQGGLVGGGNQVVFSPGFKVNPSWIKMP